MTTVDDDEVEVDDDDLDVEEDPEAVPFDQDRLDVEDDLDSVEVDDPQVEEHEALSFDQGGLDVEDDLDSVEVDDPEVEEEHEALPFDQDRLDVPEAPRQVELGDDELAPTGEHADLVPPSVPSPRPSRREHRAELKRSARRVRRVVRHIDAWSVFKVASIFVICVWGVIVLASLLIWRAAESSGSVENTEEFVKDIGFKDFDFDPQQMFEALLSAGAVLAVAAIFFIVLLTVLFNLICDMTGGLRVTMIEQDLADARRRGNDGSGD